MQKSKKTSTFIRLVKDLKEYYWFIGISIFGMLLLAGSQLVCPLITKRIVELITSGDKNIANKAITLGIILLAAYLLQSVGQYLRSYFSHIAAWNYIDGLRTKIYSHIQGMSLGYFHDKQTGQLMSRISTDTTNLEPLIAHGIPDIIVNGIVFIGSAVIIFVINWGLALISLCTVPVTSVLVYIYATKFRPRFKKAHEKIGELNGVVQDELSGIKEISAFNKQDCETEKVRKASHDHNRAILSALLGSAIFNPVILLASNVGLVLVIVFGGNLAGRGLITAAEIVAFMMYVAHFYQPLTSLTQIFEQINTALTAVERSYEILDTEPEIKSGTFKLEKGTSRGEIEFRNVSFRYNENKEIIENLSFRLEHGKSLALVGPTGIGKTTIANLIARFYDVQEGEILIDGVNVKDWDIESLRNQMSIVLQDVFLFNGSIADNIGFGMENATREEIMEAGRLANAEDFILETEDGYDTYVGERGLRLSGGQKQRISIARAVLRDMPILILDEATSSVDTKTEKLIQEALDNLSRDRTTIVIAHRLQTIRDCDIIIVLGENGIEEMGSHEELLNLKGKYWEMLNQ